MGNILLAKEFLKRAFELGEELDSPVLLRITTRIAHVKGVVQRGEVAAPTDKPEIEKHPEKFVMLPAMARRRRVVVEERMMRCKEIAETADFNVIEDGDSTRGFITSGVSYLYVKEAFPEAAVLKLGMCWPLPEKKIREVARERQTRKLYDIRCGEVDDALEAVINRHMKLRADLATYLESEIILCKSDIASILADDEKEGAQ